MNADPETPEADRAIADDVTARVDRLRALRSAWGVLAPAGVGDEADEIAETGRAITEHLSTIADSHSDVMPSALTSIDTLLLEFETSRRDSADATPPAHRSCNVRRSSASLFINQRCK